MSRAFGSVRQLPSKKDTARKRFGRFQARFTAPDGTQVKAPTTFATKLDAEGWLAHERKQIDRGEWLSPQQRKLEERKSALTVAGFLEQWLTRRKQELRLSTYQLYERVLESRVVNPGKHLSPAERDSAPGVLALAQTPLSELDSKAIYAWWDDLSRVFPTANFNHKAYIYLRSAMSDAVERELLDSNPVNVKSARKKPVPKTKELPREQDLRAIVEATPERYQFVTMLCLYSGLRLGEALALKREHLKNDGTANEPEWRVQVRGNLQRIKTDSGKVAMELQPPKTDAGYRDVPIFPKWNHIVAQHLEKFAPASKNEYLTTTEAGNPVMDTSYRSIFNRAKTKANAPQDITPHYGRTFLITELASEGATPAEIGTICGQSDLSTITEVYMSVRPDSMADVIRRVGARFDLPADVASLADKRKEKRA